MTEEYDRIENGRNIVTAEQSWDSSVDFSNYSTTHKLFEALLSEQDRIDAELEAIYNQQHIDSATGDDLDQFGDLVNVQRKSDEGDDKYRSRIKANFVASIISGTWDDYIQFCSSVLDVGVDSILLQTDYKGQPATVTVSIPASIYDDLSITGEESVELLGKGIPAGHEVNVLEKGTLRLKSDGEIDDPTKGLTSDDIDSGGTLAEDVV